MYRFDRAARIFLLNFDILRPPYLLNHRNLIRLNVVHSCHTVEAGRGSLRKCVRLSVNLPRDGGKRKQGGGGGRARERASTDLQGEIVHDVNF